jgi:hypothetical protein
VVVAVLSLPLAVLRASEGSDRERERQSRFARARPILARIRAPRENRESLKMAKMNLFVYSTYVIVEGMT